MNIRIIAVGKIKEKYLQQGIAEYLKRLSAYAKVEIIEVPDEKAPEKISAAQGEQIKEREGEKIARFIREDSYLIALAIDGERFSSEKLAQYIADQGLKGKSDLTLLIGGSLGLSRKLLERCDFKLSFSAMTFPHQLMRLILLEQIYRCFKINKGEPYHK